MKKPGPIRAPVAIEIPVRISIALYVIAVSGAQAMRDYAKGRVKELKLSGQGKVRINQAGCLDRCKEGPVIVIYPEEVWYTYVDKDDIDEIIDEHLVHGRVVERLRI